jgi:hypothetical protein
MCGLASSAFARHYLRNHGCFLFLWVLRCFTSPRSLQLPYVFRQRSPDITPVSFEVSLFGDPRIEARLPAPRGLSQVTTSFVGSWCQGIHRLPLVACCYYKDARVHCEVLKMRAVAGRCLGTDLRSAGRPVAYLRPNPQDPTACLGFSALRVDVPLLQAGSTDDKSDEEAYWSMFHIPAPARLQSKAGEPSGWTDLQICQMAP